VARQTQRLLPEIELSKTPGQVRLYATSDSGHLQAASSAWLGLQAGVTALRFI
jgi:hypothetical protein